MSEFSVITAAIEEMAEGVHAVDETVHWLEQEQHDQVKLTAAQTALTASRAASAPSRSFRSVRVIMSKFRWVCGHVIRLRHASSTGLRRRRADRR